MTWQLSAALNGVIGFAYLAIAWIIVRGLRRAGQLHSNRLALATAAIFLTCGIHHASDPLQMLAPLVGLDQQHGAVARSAVMWQMDLWDLIGAAVAVFYLSLRRSYGRLLDRPDMFENPERRRYEERLESERASLAEAQAVARLGSWEMDLGSGQQFWSAQMYEVVGIASDAELSEALTRQLPDSGDRDKLSAAIAGATAAGGDFEVTFGRTLPSGEKRYLRTVGRLIAGEAGRAGRLVGTTQDVTAVTRAEQARAEAEEALQVTVAHAPIGVALIDLSPQTRGRLLSANEALARITGHSVAALEEMSLGSLTHPDDGPRLEQELARLDSSLHARIELELRAVHADGRPMWLLLAGGSVPAGTQRARGVFHVMDIGERKRFEGQLQQLADHDALTGLFNRRRFEQELVRVLAESERYERRGAVLLLDLDGFKYVNDTLGHSAGDELVTRIGRALRGVLRDTDVIGRIGGDEFAMILSGADETDAQLVAEKLLAICRDCTVLVSHDHHLARVTASIGISLIEPGMSVGAEEILVEADVAMYEAKAVGKDRACVHQRKRSERIRVREPWLDRLRHAAVEGRFELLAQPIVAICETGIDRYELLLRLRGDDGELISPGTFLYNAERFDLIQQIDRWVFTQAAELLARHASYGNELVLSVNLSARTLTDPNFLEDLSKVLHRYPITPGRLIVEVTETAAIVNIDRAREVSRGIRELGCSFALDDFGAGFASFYYLKHLDFDYLKIDGEFIKSLPVNATDRLVVRSIVDIARELGAHTIAEFVGSDETVELLRGMGVGYGQGFHLGGPGRLEDVLPTLLSL